MINNTDAAITIDTIRFFKVDNVALRFGMALFIDTINKINLYLLNGTYRYNVSSLSYPVATCSNGNKLKINGKDTLKISNEYFVNYVVSVDKNSAKLSLCDTVKMLFISSNNGRDSITAIVNAFISGGIKINKCLQKTKSQINIKSYLLDGRIVKKEYLNKNKEINKIIITKEIRLR